MPLILSSSFVSPCFYENNVKGAHVLVPQITLSHPHHNSISCNILQKRLFANKHASMILKHKSPLEFITRASVNSNYELAGESNMEDDWRDQEDVGADPMDSPWEGAILYQRNPSISHLEYCTTLERLGLGYLSTEVSTSRASLMGLRVTKSVKDFPYGTPVLVSIDVTRKKQRLRLDGIIRTVITLGCNRCGGLAADCVFSNFSLVLTEEPIEEPDIINMGVIYGEGKFNGSSGTVEQEEDNDASIDLDDWLYFPPEEKVIDISKNVRDMVHLEITINALCDPMCKGLCLKCGQNLNISNCNCSEESSNPKSYGPLGGLKERMQQ
ncbi:large ribosomal RNA subunit accumulation protein YCED homolog 1, chloroplastic [Cynara cardunculus var. scolymus]|uniref:large ribosomal RNA subunit accumulation protein YCED homolog 1, chloroplastic n=1 Tax=Cynara cardunculus var. scolymus TaxID=59895 RepID=UPI000D62EBB8|nr:large ribosomal RNA subunit accumulation protein YCED homolog 1, chloroplastic [Cynara cardunculus var. scolymus]